MLGGSFKRDRLTTGLLLLASLLSFVLSKEAGSEWADGSCVMVSGATGFVAGHVVEILLKKGYTVHGTVRSLKSEDKIAFLKEFNETLPGTLKLFEASLTGKDPFNKAISGCAGVLHIASAVMSPHIPPAEFVDIAVSGTLSALEAAKKSKTVKRVVVTSSVASIYPTKSKIASGEAYGIDDWNEMATQDYCTYAYSKTQAEKATLEWLKKEKKKPFQYSSIHFPAAFGPQQNARVTSSQIMPQLVLANVYPVLMPMGVNVIDVRDVARAHVHALESEKADGRYIVALDPSVSKYSLKDVSNTFQQLYPDHPVPYLELPVGLSKLIALLDKRVDQCMLDAWKRAIPGYDGSRLVKELGFEYKHTNLTETFRDTAESFFKHGVATRGKGSMLVTLLPFSPLLLLTLFYAVRLLCFSSGKPKTKTS